MSRMTLATGAGALLIGSLAAPAWAGGAGGVRASARPIAGEYIVVLDESVADVAAAARELAGEHGLEVVHIYEHALKGFAVRMPEVSAFAVSRNPRVAYVEQNGEVELAQGITWGQDRIDQRNRPLNNVYSRVGVSGSGVTVYVIDSGIYGAHDEFRTSASDSTSRVAAVGFDGVLDGRGIGDCHGHGTHTADTIGGFYFGVAPGVTLVSVRVFGCSGSGSVANVIAGVDWVTGNHAAGVRAVANMSLAAAPSGALDAAVRNSHADGTTYVVAAGNRGVDACSVSPARVRAVITVAATQGVSPGAADRRALFGRGKSSNWGPCVDVFAPGKAILGAWHDDTLETLSGTSSAAAHVAGAAALYLNWNPTSPPAATALALIRSATVGKVSDTMGSPNRLLFSRLSQGLVNPGFESGVFWWGVSAPAGVNVITSFPEPPGAHSGAWYARLGGLATAAETTELYQNVAIPTDATSATFSFYVYVATEETPTTRPRDKLFVEVWNSAGTMLLKRLATFSDLDATGRYRARSYSLMAFTGQTIMLRLRSQENDRYATSFRVDSVAVNVGH